MKEKCFTLDVLESECLFWESKERAKEQAEKILAEYRDMAASDGWPEEEGYCVTSDTEWDAGELRRAALCYLRNTTSKVPAKWPWNDEYWKPTKDPVCRLVKAGALIAAEIDRLIR